MSKRNLLIVLILVAAAAAVIFLLQPCGPAGGEQTAGGLFPAMKEKLKAKLKPKSPEAKAAEPAPAAEAPAQVPAHEIDNAPPVNLTGGEEIPNVAKCVTANFPPDAKPHVKTATVNVRLVVDKYGNVRSSKTISVEFPVEPAEDVLPLVRKLFIQAGNRAFGSKKCPPHVVNGDPVGYAIEVPLQYKH